MFQPYEMVFGVLPRKETIRWNFKFLQVVSLQKYYTLVLGPTLGQLLGISSSKYPRTMNTTCSTLCTLARFSKKKTWSFHHVLPGIPDPKVFYRQVFHL